MMWQSLVSKLAGIAENVSKRLTPEGVEALDDIKQDKKQRKAMEIAETHLRKVTGYINYLTERVDYDKLDSKEIKKIDNIIRRVNNAVEDFFKYD